MNLETRMIKLEDYLNEFESLTTMVLYHSPAIGDLDKNLKSLAAYLKKYQEENDQWKKQDIQEPNVENAER